MISPAVALRRVRPADADLSGLDPRERAQLSPAAVAGRRAQFTAGRRAAHAALHRHSGDAAAGAAVVPARGRGGGRPIAVDAAGRPLGVHVSITHAGRLAAAAVASSPIGLDLVEFEAHGEGLRAEAFVHGELARWAEWSGLLPGGEQATALAFAAKEAALKWLGTGLELALHAIRVEPAGPGRPARLGGGVRALALAVRVEAGRDGGVLQGWIAGSPRRVLVVMSGDR